MEVSFITIRLVRKAYVAASLFAILALGACNADISDHVGYYDATENCGQASNYEYTFYFGKGDNNAIFFNGLLGFNESISGTISGSKIRIPLQTIPGMTYTTVIGEGKLNKNKETISLEITIDDGSDEETCTTVAEKQ